jgi:hypothetical protein
MRLAPVPLFFYRSPLHAVEYSGLSGQITHGDRKAYDACRYYGALMVAALRGYKKNQLLDRDFYSNHITWFGGKPLCTEIKLIAEGSYQKAGGYKDGIRGKGYIVNALEAALWAFWSDGDSFEKGVLDAVNLGDDTDTTAAIYGQLAGAYYGYKKLPQRWVKHVYAQRFMLNLSKWITYEGQIWQPSESISSFIPASSYQPPLYETTTETFASKPHSSIQSSHIGAPVPIHNSYAYDEKPPAEKNPHRIKLGATVSIPSQNQSILLVPSTSNQGPINYNHIDSLSNCQLPPVGINAKMSLRKSNSNYPSSTMQASALPFNLPQYYETTIVESNQHGPILPGTQSISSKGQLAVSSMRTKIPDASINDDKKPYSISKPPSYETNLLPPTPSSGNSGSSTTMVSKPEKSRSRNRFSGLFNTKNRSNSPVPFGQVASIDVNGSNRSGLPTNNNGNLEIARESVPNQQASAYKNNSLQPAGPSRKEKRASGGGKSKSRTVL